MVSPCRRADGGQIVALFTLFLVVLLGFAALAIDVSRAYALLRLERSVADATSLAGAQELQEAGNRRPVNDGMRQRARQVALDSLASQLGETPTPTCGTTTADIIRCPFPNTGYRVSIKTPAPACVACDPDRAVQVTVEQPGFDVTFARVFGQTTWNVSLTSVAGMDFTASYGVVTLRPVNVRRNGTDANQNDIDVNGSNTRLFIVGGDVGSNTTALTNSDGYISLEPGYRIYHIDDITPDPWNKDLAGNPQGRLLEDQILDPQYRYPSEAGLTSYAQQSDGQDGACSQAPAGMTPAPTLCYRPGIYESDFADLQNTDVDFFAPGVYVFRQNVTIHGSLYAGIESGKPGVVLIMEQSKTFAANNALGIVLNSGPSDCADKGCRPQPVVDGAGVPVVTPGGIPLTVMVTRDDSCFVGPTPILCSDNQNDTLTLPGNGQLYVTGVIYAPSDYVKINGDNSNQVGTLGQLIAWRVSYSGGAQLNQYVVTGEEVGVLRLDAACTTPGTTTAACTP